MNDYELTDRELKKVETDMILDIMADRYQVVQNSIDAGNRGLQIMSSFLDFFGRDTDHTELILDNDETWLENGWESEDEFNTALGFGFPEAIAAIPNIIAKINRA